MLQYGVSNGFDSSTALAWTKYFSSELQRGELYPRWIPDMNRGAGSPAFFFYAPFSYYVTSLVAWMMPGHKLTFSLAWGETILISLSSVAFYAYASRDFRRLPAACCAVVYMLLPYHFEIDLWHRQALGELANYIWMPVVLHYTERLMREKRGVVGLAISYSLMVFSHLPSTLLFSICLAAYLLVVRPGYRPAAFLSRFGCAIGIGLLLAAIYWVPAVFCRNLIHPEAWLTWIYDFHLWLFPVKSLQAFRGVTELHVFGIRVFQVVSMTALVGVLCGTAALHCCEPIERRRLFRVLAFGGAACFLMTSCSAFVWETFPLLANVQFPYRFAMEVDLATTIAILHAVGGMTFSSLSLTRWRVSGAAVVTLGLLGWCAATADVRNLLDLYYPEKLIQERDYYVRNGVDAPEYTPKWAPFDVDTFDNTTDIAGRPRVIVDPVAGTVQVARWRSRSITLDVALSRAASVTVRQFYWPNWSARIDNGAFQDVAPERKSGLIRLDLPDGSYHVQMRLRWLTEEIVGGVMSLIGVLLVVAACVSDKISDLFRRRQQNAQTVHPDGSTPSTDRTHNGERGYSARVTLLPGHKSELPV